MEIMICETNMIFFFLYIRIIICQDASKYDGVINYSRFISVHLIAPELSSAHLIKKLSNCPLTLKWGTAALSADVFSLSFSEVGTWIWCPTAGDPHSVPHSIESVDSCQLPCNAGLGWCVSHNALAPSLEESSKYL